jgi:hypothetical protein
MFTTGHGWPCRNLLRCRRSAPRTKPVQRHDLNSESVVGFANFLLGPQREARPDTASRAAFDPRQQNPAGFVSWRGLCLVAGIGFTAFAALGVDARPAGAGLGPNDRFIHRSG